MKFVCLFFIIIFVGCEKTKDTVALENALLNESNEVTLDAGEITLYVSSEHQTLLHYQWGLANIWLQNEQGDYIQLVPDDQAGNLMINFTDCEESSHVLLTAKIPVGRYNAVVFFIDYEYAQVLMMDDDLNVLQPYLFDSVGEQLIDENTLHPQLVHLLDNQWIDIEQNKHAELSLHIDVEASLRISPMDDDENKLDMISLPSIKLSKGVRYPNDVVAFGMVDSFGGGNVNLVPYYSKNISQPLLALNMQNVVPRLNWTESSLVDIQDNVNTDLSPVLTEVRGVFDGEAQQINVETADFYRFDENINALVSGFHINDMFYGSLITFDIENNEIGEFPLFYEAPMIHFSSFFYGEKLVGLGSVSNEFILSDNKEGVAQEMIFNLPTEQVDQQELIALNHINMNKATLEKKMRIDNGSIQNGEFLSDTTFWAKGQLNEESKLELIQKENIEDKQLRYRYSLPLLNDKNALTLVDNTFVISHSDIDYSLSELWIRGTLQSLDIEEFPVSTIILTNAKACIHLERLTPFVETHCFSSADEWVSAYSTYIEQGFLMNDLLIDGLWQSNGFLAEALLITLYADVGLKDSKVEAAVSEESNKQPVLEGLSLEPRSIGVPLKRLAKYLQKNISMKKLNARFQKKLSDVVKINNIFKPKSSNPNNAFQRLYEVRNTVDASKNIISDIKKDLVKLNEQTRARNFIVKSRSTIIKINKWLKPDGILRTVNESQRERIELEVSKIKSGIANNNGVFSRNSAAITKSLGDIETKLLESRLNNLRNDNVNNPDNPTIRPKSPIDQPGISPGGGRRPRF